MNAKVIFGLVLIFGYCQAKGELVFSLFNILTVFVVSLGL